MIAKLFTWHMPVFFFFYYHRARLVHVFKNWKLLFENICGNTCGWKSTLKCVKWCLKIKNYCLKTQTKYPHTDQKTDIKRERIWKAKNRKKKKNEKRGEIAREKRKKKRIKSHITSADHGNALPLIDRFSFFPFISFSFLKTFFLLLLCPFVSLAFFSLGCFYVFFICFLSSFFALLFSF